MYERKLTVRVSREALDNAKRYAAENGTTLTNLIDAFLSTIPAADQTADAPILRRLTGILPADVSADSHRAHLEKKYGQDAGSAD